MQRINELDIIKARAVSLIKRKRAAGIDIYYLSQLSNDIGFNKGFRFENRFGIKFHEFINSVSDASVKTSEKDGTTRYISLHGNTPSSSKRPRYPKEIWEAFAKPLRNGEIRYFDVENLSVMYEINTIKGENIIEIPSHYISDEEITVFSDIVSKNIGDWLLYAGISPEIFAK